MIKSFKHKGLKQFFEMGSTKGINANQADKIRRRLSIIDLAKEVKDIDIPGYHLHKLSGDRSELWSVRVTGNWRITFNFEDGDAYIVNYEDYH